MSHRILHLSDLHLSATPGVRGRLDADVSLELVLRAAGNIADLTAIVVTGDLADDGSLPAYQRAWTTLTGFAAERGAHVMVSPGNHDSRDPMREIFGSGHIAPDGSDSGARGPAGRFCAATTLPGLRIVTLDSLVVGRWYGELGSEQLVWLRQLLADDPHLPTLLALHHPPVTIGHPIQERVRLADRVAFTEVLGHGSPAAVLCGHFHQQIAQSRSGVPIWVTPGVASRIDHLTGPAGNETAYLGGSATVVDLTDPSAPSFAVVAAQDPAAGTELYSVSLDELASELTEFGIPGVQH